MGKKSFFVVDGHCDSISLLRDGESHLVNEYNFSKKYPQLQFVALFCGGHGQTEEDSYRLAMRYLGHFSIEKETEKDLFVQVRTYGEIEKAFAEGRHAVLLTEEGGSCVRGSVKIFDDIYAAGIRIFGLAWLSNGLAKSNRIADGETDDGLTSFGREIVEEGNRIGMIFDVSHLSDRSFYDVVGLAARPPVATHSNFRAVCGHSRNLTDDMAKKIAARGGVIGLNLYPPFISDDPEKRTLEGLFLQLEYGLDLVGEDCIGFGFDIDGVDGDYPPPLDTSSSIHDRVIDAMISRGYSDTLIGKISSGNWLSYLKKNL